MKTVRASTRFSIVKRSNGESAVEKASYISRENLQSEYYGNTYNHTAHEDLVHSEIMLPAHAPKEYADRATLWNCVEASEKAKDAQLARMVKLSMPNEWSYELSTEVMRDYIQRNFVSQGMCADFAIHDSVNEKTGDRNLHAHILLTMREIGEDGKWKPKWKKVYELDEKGERIKNKKGKYKSHPEATNDWSSPKKGAVWRTDFADTVNAVNKERGIAVFWEHRRNDEIDPQLIPTKHMGAKAAALEKKGIKTEVGEYNRAVLEHNATILEAMAEIEHQDNIIRWSKKEMARLKASVVKEVIPDTKAEPERKPKMPFPKPPEKYSENPKVQTQRKLADSKREKPREPNIQDFLMELSDKGYLMVLPTGKSESLDKITWRDKLQEPEYCLMLLKTEGVLTWENFSEYMKGIDKRLNDAEGDYKSINKKVQSLQAYVDAYQKYQELKSVNAEYEKSFFPFKGSFEKNHKQELQDFKDAKKVVDTKRTAEGKIPIARVKNELSQATEGLETAIEERDRLINVYAVCDTVKNTKIKYEQMKEQGDFSKMPKPKVSMKNKLNRFKDKAKEQNASRTREQQTHKKRDDNSL